MQRATALYVLPPALRGAIEDALVLGSAEIAIRTVVGDGVVHVARDAIAWVVRTGSAEHLSAALEERFHLERGVLRAIHRSCLEHGANFAEALIDAGLIERAALRDALLDHHARQLWHLIADGIVSVRLVPRIRGYSSDLVFTLDELLERRTPIIYEDRRPSIPASSAAKAPEEPPSREEKGSALDMGNVRQSLEEIMKIDGAIGAAIVDWESGLTLGTIGGGAALDIELAAAGHTDVARAKMAVMRQLGIRGSIEDVLFTLESQYHLIRPLTKASSLFLYVAIDKSRGNLGLARHRLKVIEEALTP